jgi:isopentenyl diphosphate isomerase/L-lactate dehydrogenase-like FMN-dependent dehydrogenase
VIFGRPTLYGVAAAGQAGAARALQIMRTEIDQVLAQIGSTAFEGLNADNLWRPGAVPSSSLENLSAPQRVAEPVAG